MIFVQKASKRKNYFNILSFTLLGGKFSIMNKYLIIGGGIPGVLLANILQRKGLPFLGLEKSKLIGTQSNFGQFRIYQDNSVGFVKELCGSIDWVKVDEHPQERKKGEWVSTNNDYIDEEKAFLGNPFYQPIETFGTVMGAIKQSIENNFITDKSVEKIDVEKKIVTCQDGSEHPFECLIWCDDLKGLLKATQSPPKVGMKNSRKKDDVQGGIHLEMELSNSFIPFSNSVIFPFRYKDYKLRALGINDPKATPSGASKMHWIVFLEKELAEDREEVAKVIRAMKRELQKEFPELKTVVLKEKIVFEPKVESYTPSEVKGLELFPGIFYVGSEAQLPDTRAENSPIDLAIENCKRFEETIQ